MPRSDIVGLPERDPSGAVAHVPPLGDFNLIRDPHRLQALRDTGLLDSPPEEPFDRLARMATRLLHAPVALVSLVDQDRQFFKSCIGLPAPWAQQRETPLSHSLCQYCVSSGSPLIVDDARQHPMLWDSLAIPDIGVVAYAGIPLVTSDGARLGSFCVIDSHPRNWTDEEVGFLKDLAALTVTEIEWRALHDRARAAQLHAEKGSLEKSRLVATVAHEIRQPLSALTAAAPMLRLADESTRERVTRVVERQIAHLNRLVEDLLDIARLEGQRFVLVKERLDLCALVSDTLETLRPVITRNERTLQAKLPSAPLFLEADASRLVQVLTNLLHNAAKFTGHGDTISVVVQESPGEATIRVIDSGRGIPPELLPHLFEPFVQGNVGEAGGLGLGLAVAQGLVKLHDGTLDAHSAGLGQGSEFVVRLPLAR